MTPTRKRSHASKHRPVVYVTTFIGPVGPSRPSTETRIYFRLTRAARNGRQTVHPQLYANTQAAHRAARREYPGVRIERVS